jgi:hypothetical protein
MVYVKSILVGTATFFVSIVVLLVFTMRAALKLLPPGSQGEVGVDVVSLAKTPRFWIVAIVGFGIGFWWQFRRSSR